MWLYTYNILCNKDISCICCTWYMYVYLLDEDKSKVFVYSTTLIAIFTCGTSVLLWWLYKECFRSKDKYDVEGRYMNVFIENWLLFYFLRNSYTSTVSLCTYSYVCNYLIMFIHDYSGVYVHTTQAICVVHNLCLYIHTYILLRCIHM